MHPEVKFSKTVLDRFSDRIQNCLIDVSCRSIFKYYLEHVRQNGNLSKVLLLWTRADTSQKFTNEMQDLIDDIEGIDIPEKDLQKIDFVKEKCRILLERVHKEFVKFLRQYHEDNN